MNWGIRPRVWDQWGSWTLQTGFQSDI